MRWSTTIVKGRKVVRFNERHRVLVLCISRVQKETRLSVAIIAESASDILVLQKKPSYFLFAGMTFAATLVFEGTFTSKKEDTDSITTLVAVIAFRILMTIHTIWTCTTRAIFAHLHDLMCLLATAAGSDTILVT
jgi:hypothetical protein